MAGRKLHRPGDPLRISATIQNKVEALALANEHGATAGERPAFPPGIVRVKNVSGADLVRKELCILGEHLIDPQIVRHGERQPTYKAEHATWPEAMGRAAVVLEPIADDAFGFVMIAGFAPALVDIVRLTDQFAAPDHSNPRRLKSSDTGEFALIGKVAGVGVRTMQVGVPMIRRALWHYERTLDYPDGTVKVLGLDDTAFSGSSTVTMIDNRELMDDQIATNRGLMEQVGSTFVAVNAPCSDF